MYSYSCMGPAYIGLTKNLLSVCVWKKPRRAQDRLLLQLYCLSRDRPPHPAAPAPTLGAKPPIKTMDSSLVPGDSALQYVQMNPAGQPLEKGLTASLPVDVDDGADVDGTFGLTTVLSGFIPLNEMEKNVVQKPWSDSESKYSTPHNV
jgi:hypothetical protein